MSDKLKPLITILITIDCIMLMICMAVRKREATIIVDTADVVEQEKLVALTFDDGPSPLYTERLLDGLSERGVKASFFIMGQAIEGCEDIVKRMYDEGHLVGNHTFSHVELTKLTDEAACNEIILTNEKICEITGEYPTYIRPPYGSWNNDLECSIEMIPILWTLDTLDWKSQNVNSIVKRTMKSVKENDIILMHDVFETSVDAALIIVDRLREAGYSFVTADEMIY